MNARLGWSLLLLWLWLLPPALLAQDPQAQKQRLSAEEADFKRLLASSKAQEWGLLETLKALNKSLEAKTKQLEKVRAQVQKATGQAAKMEREIRARQVRLDHNQEWLDQQLLGMYTVQKVRHLTLFPGVSGYENYFRNQELLRQVSLVDAKRVARLAEDLEAQKKAQERRKSKLAELESLERERALHADSLAVERSQLDAYLKQQKQDQKRHQKNLREIKAQLARLDTLTSQPAAPAPAAPPTPSPTPGLGTGKGTLPSPLLGQVVQPFGGNLLGELYKKGVVVQTDEGTLAKAVLPGTVVFAGAFQGFGEMVILDHGRGSFTVYGNLENLQVKTGQAVLAGVDLGPVAFVAGPTSGYLFYFETRYRKRATDPNEWLKAPAWQKEPDPSALPPPPGP